MAKEPKLKVPKKKKPVLLKQDIENLTAVFAIARKAVAENEEYIATLIALRAKLMTFIYENNG